MNLIDLLRKLFYIRYPALMGLLLVLLGPLAVLSPAHELLANTVLVHSIPQVITLTLICFTASKFFLVQAGVVLFNAPFRFLELTPAVATPATGDSGTGMARIAWEWSISKTLWWLAGGLSLPLTSIYYSNHERMPTKEIGSFLNTLSLSEGLVGLLLALLIDFLMLLLFSAVEQKLVAPQMMIPNLLPVKVRVRPGPDFEQRLIDKWLTGFIYGLGYTEKNRHGRHFRPGHLQQVVLLAVIVVVYTILRYVSDGSTARPIIPMLPTLFFAVLGLIFVSSVLSAASFFLDFYRLPVLLLLTIVVILTYVITGRDHYFETPARSAPVEAPALTDILTPEHRVIPHDKAGRRTLVVITAPGGGHTCRRLDGSCTHRPA